MLSALSQFVRNCEGHSLFLHDYKLACHRFVELTGDTRLLAQKQRSRLLIVQHGHARSSCSPNPRGPHKRTQVDAVHAVGLHQSWRTSCLGNCSFWNNGLQAKLTFALEVKLSLSYKIVCYANTFENAVQEKRLSVLLLICCTELWKPMGNDLPTKIMLYLVQPLHNNEELATA